MSAVKPNPSADDAPLRPEPSKVVVDPVASDQNNDPAAMTTENARAIAAMEERTAKNLAKHLEQLAAQEAEDDADDEPEAKERKLYVRQLQAEAKTAVDTHLATAPPDQLRAMLAIIASKIKQKMEFDGARGEIGLAAQFAVFAFGQHIRSIPGEKRCLWVKYDPQAGIYRDATIEARELAKEVIAWAIDLARRGVRRATRSGTPEEIRAAMKVFSAAQAMQRAKVISSILDAAKTDPMLRTDLRLFDRNPDEIVVENGIVDLRTGELRPHSPENLVRKSAGTSYDPEAQCPRWERFLLQIMCGDRDLVRYLQRAFGYTLTGHVLEEVMFFMYGGGANGKSVLANVVQQLMGDYYVRVGGEFLMMSPQSNREAATPTMARLPGARIVLVNEVESGATLSGQQVKTLVSTEAISARANYSDPFEFEPTHKVWVRGNHKPIARDTDYGFWRRMHLIPFLMTIAKEDANLRLFDELCEELPGIMRWAVDGARAWYAEGRLLTAKAVADATAEYQSDSDVIERWITDCSGRAPGQHVNAADAYESYKQWAEAENLKPMSRPSLTSRLADKGIGCERRKVDGALVRFYVGLAPLVPLEPPRF